ncbi:hypothetical protein MMC16_001063 [Acarospora aff. strigata]|nr:hypothetical protein [Acarospora aff. strigata]
MLFAKIFGSLSLLAGSAVASYGSDYGSDYGSGTTESSSVVAAAANASPTSSVEAPAVAQATSSATISAPVSAAASESSPAAGMVSVQVVKVSNKNGSLTFAPNDIKATPGSMVQFHFYPKNHSVVQSTFDQPCQPINNIMPNVTGMFSGFMPVAAGASEMPVYTIMVNDTKPIWFYCSQGQHCQAGMVGVINAPAANESRTVTSFQALAKQASVNLSPGDQAANDVASSVSSATSSISIASQSAGAASPSNVNVSPSTNGNSTATTSSTPLQVTVSAASGGILGGLQQTLRGVGFAGLVAAVGAFVL